MKGRAAGESNRPVSANLVAVAHDRHGGHAPFLDKIPFRKQSGTNAAGQQRPSSQCVGAGSADNAQLQLPGVIHSAGLTDGAATKLADLFGTGGCQVLALMASVSVCPPMSLWSRESNESPRWHN